MKSFRLAAAQLRPTTDNRSGGGLGAQGLRAGCYFLIVKVRTIIGILALSRSAPPGRLNVASC